MTQPEPPVDTPPDAEVLPVPEETGPSTGTIQGPAPVGPALPPPVGDGGGPG